MILFFLIIMCEENSSEPKSSETPKSRDRDDRLSEPARSRRVTESENIMRDYLSNNDSSVMIR